MAIGTSLTLEISGAFYQSLLELLQLGLELRDLARGNVMFLLECVELAVGLVFGALLTHLGTDKAPQGSVQVSVSVAEHFRSNAARGEPGGNRAESSLNLLLRLRPSSPFSYTVSSSSTALHTGAQT